MEVWPGGPYPARSDVRRRGHQLRAVLRGRRGRRALPVRRRRHRDARPDDRARRVGVARLPAAGQAWPALRLPRARPLRPRARPPLRPDKLLIDPYAKALEGEIDWAPACFSYDFGDPKKRNTEDSAPHTMKSVVINPFFDWQDDRPPRRPYHETVIYEAHVKGHDA